MVVQLRAMPIDHGDAPLELVQRHEATALWIGCGLLVRTSGQPPIAVGNSTYPSKLMIVDGYKWVDLLADVAKLKKINRCEQHQKADRSFASSGGIASNPQRTQIVDQKFEAAIVRSWGAACHDGNRARQS